MLKALEAGYKLFFWPSSIDCKDINQMIQEGFSIENMNLENNVFKGIEGKLKLSAWSKK